MALFFFILRDVHFMLSVICECLVEEKAEWEEEEEVEEGGIQESGSRSVSKRSCYDTEWRDLNFVGGKGW